LVAEGGKIAQAVATLAQPHQVISCRCRGESSGLPG
jgi:hypothetical protein